MNRPTTWEEGGYTYWDGGNYRQSTLPDGRILTERWDPYGGEDGNGGYKAFGAPYNQPEGRVDRAEQDKLARDKLDYDKARDAALAEIKRLDKVEAKTRQDALDLIDAGKYEDAKKRLKEADDYKRQRDKVADTQTAADSVYRDKQLVQQADIAKSGATGRWDGVPSLGREQWEAEQANAPGNYFNIAFRSSGMQPPGMPPA